MALISCPQCGAIGEEGTICDFCGSTIIKKNITSFPLEELFSQKKDKEEKNNDQKVNIYTSDIKENLSLEPSKKLVLNELIKISQDKKLNKFNEFILPLEEKIGLFSYKLNRYNILLYWYNVEAEDKKTDKLKKFYFLALAEDNGTLPAIITSEFKFRHSYDPEKEFGVRLLKQEKIKSSIKKDDNEIWKSLYARKLYEKFFYRYEKPLVKLIEIPIFVVTLELPSFSENRKERIFKEFILGKDAEIINDKDSNPHHLLAEYYLGENWFHIIEQKEREKRKPNKTNKEKKKNNFYYKEEERRKY